MKSIIEELYNGNVNPGETGFARNSAYGKAVKRACECEEKLSKLLDEPAKLLFEADPVPAVVEFEGKKECTRHRTTQAEAV